MSPDLSAGLEYLLCWEWDTGGLGQGVWFDGVAEGTVKVRKRLRLVVRGFMIYGGAGRGTGQFVDHFEADLRVVENVDELATYTLRFGREGTELRRFCYGDFGTLRREPMRLKSWKWAYVFTKGDVL